MTLSLVTNITAGWALISILFAFTGCNGKAVHETGSETSLIRARLVEGYSQLKAEPRSPRCFEDGALRLVSPNDWTSGFYPGCLWLGYELTGDTVLRNAAESRTALLEEQQYNGGDHDIGFRMMCSYGNALKLQTKPEYRDILVQSARTLAGRYDPTIGMIRSWDHNTDKWSYPVIIDNMMNLELLMWAFRETGDSSLLNIALTHADNTMKYHFREDNSTCHVVDFDPSTGRMTGQFTHQGLADTSAWARGQAWGLYGFAMMYEWTGDKRYLRQAEDIAAFILDHPNLPEDLVPYWDFDAPAGKSTPRDASAAAITCSALCALSKMPVDDPDKYRISANAILRTLLTGDYFIPEFEGQWFLLDHSTGSLPKDSEVDVPIIYADYYFLEALLRSKNL